MPPRILAVAVTYNRSAMVTRLAQAVAAGAVVPDELLVVDNGSTDDTVESLQELGVRVLELGRNTGGAGGFAAGLTAFLESEADLVWLMDDDGVPAADCLELLLPYADRYDFVGPAVVAEQDPQRLCFPIRLPGRSKVVHALADVEAAAVDGVVEDVVIPFNGVLLTRALVERIGVVREELFIWGDDVEYLWRARRAGARIATVVAARFAHPATDDLGTPELFGLTTYNHSPSDLKHYCMCRNNVANLRQYAGPLGVLAFAVKTVWFYLFTRPDLGRLRMSLGAMADGWRGRWGRHERYLRSTPTRHSLRSRRGGDPGMTETVAVVVVTYNRADLLRGLLAGLGDLPTQPDAVIVVDNASSDHTADVLAGAGNVGLQVLKMSENTGGAGGFHAGVRAAYEGGWDRIWLMDDDVVPAPDCLDVLLAVDEPCLMVTREDREGRLAEKAAVDFDLTHATVLRPKRATVETTYVTRDRMPALVELQNVPFEGFMVRREVVAAIGLPDPTFFIFYDDVDYALRARRAGFRIWGVRDAVVVRQLDFDQQHDLAGWKGFYMYRNLFVVHLRYGATPAVRAKPWLLTAGVVLLSPARGGVAEARNVIRAMRSARTMRAVPPVSVD